MAKLIDLKLKMARILSLGSWQNDTNGLVGIIDEAYQLGLKSAQNEIRIRTVYAITEAFRLGRESVQKELADEAYNGTSILRDQSAVVDVSQVVDNPAGDPWIDGD